MSEHTKEPWSMTEGSACPMIMSGDEFVTVALSGSTVDLGRDKANARRIVGCVNACAGVSTDFIEGLEQGLKVRGIPLDKLIQELNAQRDELLATLIELRDVLRTVPTMQHREYDSIGIKVNNVIAKCEGI